VPIERIEIFSLWVGFGDPPAHAAKLIITRQGERFVRERLPERVTDEVPPELVSRLEQALALPPARSLDPAMFDIPEAALRLHYDSIWTDDNPAHLVQVKFLNGDAVTIRIEDQHAFMLPLKVARTTHAAGRRDEPTPDPPLRRGGCGSAQLGPAAGSTGRAVTETFDPRLSLAIAALMPEGYLAKDRLAGKCGALERDLPESLHRDEPCEESRTAEQSEKDEAEVARHNEAVFTEIFRVLAGIETPEEIAAAERAGKLSERLLKRISAADARGLLSRGADPNVADDVGQTALMHAAFPPFDRERFRLLVKAGANLEARRNDGFTGLHLACAGGETQSTLEWVQAGADIAARTPGGATPLMLAATWPGIVRALLAAGAEVNAADDEGHTPLGYAIVRQSTVDGERMLSAVRELLATGVDVNCPDRDRVTPREHARQALARVEVEEEVFQALHPQAEAALRDKSATVRLAETIVNLVAAAAVRM
jgi:hypothetical protein